MTDGKENHVNDRTSGAVLSSAAGWGLVVLYNLAFSIFAIFYFTTFLKKLKQARDVKQLLRERFGFLPEALRRGWGERPVVWIHAVSVGEVMAVQKLLWKLSDHLPEHRFILTTVTGTGQKIAKELEGDRISVCYFPLDLTFVVRRFLKFFNPVCILLMETEIWPNLLMEAGRHGVPVGILNARLSERSCKRYGFLSFCLRPLFKGLEFVLTQSQSDADRFRRLGVKAERVQVLGNMKFDNAALGSGSVSGEALRRQWGFVAQDVIWIAGSTHPGEEESLVKIYQLLRQQFQSLKLMIAPRHIERSTALKHSIQSLGLRVRLAGDPESPSEPSDVLILDCLGVLKHLYAMADVVFMGGSLIRHGGQNPIEPAGFKRAIIHGPHTFNFGDLYATLDREGGALMVNDEMQLEVTLRKLLEDERERAKVGERAFAVVRRFQGATERHLDWALGFLVPKNQERKNDVDSHEKLFSSVRGGI